MIESLLIDVRAEIHVLPSLFANFASKSFLTANGGIGGYRHTNRRVTVLGEQSERFQGQFPETGCDMNLINLCDLAR